MTQSIYFAPSFATDAFLAEKRVMVLVRDPRDVLTSPYFSVRKSHRIPVGEAGAGLGKLREKANVQDIDEFILGQARQGYWADRFARLSDIRDIGERER